MGFISRLFSGKKADEPEVTGDHAVIVRFDYGSTDLGPMWELEDLLETTVSKAKVGELDGHEIALDASHGFFYMYGPDADKLFAAVRTVIEKSAAIRNAEATLRYGPPEEGVREVKVAIMHTRT